MIDFKLDLEKNLTLKQMTWAIDLAKKVEFQRNLDLKTKIKDTTVIATDNEILDALSNSSLSCYIGNCGGQTFTAQTSKR